MGRRGPKPQPAAIKTKKGNPGHRPIGADPEPKDSASAVRGKIAAPPWLKKEGLDVWRRLAPRLSALKLLTFADVETFARYCRNFARWLDMNRIVDREGETYESESVHGKLKRVNPAYLIADRLERQLLAAEDRFGMNPAERQRIFAARSVHADPATRDLFGEEGKREGDPAARPAEPARPAPGAIGLLN
jgi:P27 family predicted phage terminase small subunit